MEVIAI